MQDSNVPAKFPIPFASSAGSDFIRPIPQASQIGVQNGAASLTDGFPPDCFSPIAVGGSWPFGQDFNGLLNQITAWMQWMNAAGPIYYDGAFSSAVGGYPKGSLLSNASTPGSFWVSSVDNNTSDPDTGGANWLAFPPFTPVQQGGGTGMFGNKIYLGWDGGSNILAQVDANSAGFGPLATHQWTLANFNKQLSVLLTDSGYLSIPANNNANTVYLMNFRGVTVGSGGATAVNINVLFPFTLSNALLGYCFCPTNETINESVPPWTLTTQSVSLSEINVLVNSNGGPAPTNYAVSGFVIGY